MSKEQPHVDQASQLINPACRDSEVFDPSPTLTSPLGELAPKNNFTPSHNSLRKRDDITNDRLSRLDLGISPHASGIPRIASEHGNHLLPESPIVTPQRKELTPLHTSLKTRDDRRLSRRNLITSSYVSGIPGIASENGNHLPPGSPIATPLHSTLKTRDDMRVSRRDLKIMSASRCNYSSPYPSPNSANVTPRNALHLDPLRTGNKTPLSCRNENPVNSSNKASRRNERSPPHISPTPLRDRGRKANPTETSALRQSLASVMPSSSLQHNPNPFVTETLRQRKNQSSHDNSGFRNEYISTP